MKIQIYPALIVCTSTTLELSDPLEHRRRDVVINHARLVPPPFPCRTSIELIDDRGHRAVIVVYGMRRVRSALEQAGFAMHDRYIWLPQKSPWPPWSLNPKFRRPSSRATGSRR
jgi:hypothetical protein